MLKNKKPFIDNYGFLSQYFKKAYNLYKIKNEPSLATITLTQNFCQLYHQKIIITKKASKRTFTPLAHKPLNQPKRE